MALLVQLALIVIIVRCVYVGINLVKQAKKDWLNIAFYISIIIVALSLILT